MAQSPLTLLICTVGGTSEPVVKALKYWQPARVWFVHTPQSKPLIEAEIVPRSRDLGLDLDAGRYELIELADGQDLQSCVDRLRQLTPEVGKWGERGEGFQVVVDLTGGTKCMSAAIALQSSRWRCRFSYVGGSERTKNGVGVVVSGAEEVVDQVNPWDGLGYKAVEDFIVLFDQRVFLAAASVAETAKTRVIRPDRKRELSVLEHLANAFDAWDRFDHQTSRNEFEAVEKSANDLRAVLGQAKADRVLDAVTRSTKHLGLLCGASPPSRHHVVDLLANARRRKEEGRLDDAVARLYRAIEAIAQVALKEGHGIESTERVPVSSIPSSLGPDWSSKAEDGFKAIALQDAYTLLEALGDPIGRRFKEAKLDDSKSPLSARNRSILAHGFERVSEKVFDRLWSAALALAEIQDADLPSFTALGDRKAEQR